MQVSVIRADEVVVSLEAVVVRVEQEVAECEVLLFQFRHSSFSPRRARAAYSASLLRTKRPRTERASVRGAPGRGGALAVREPKSRLKSAHRPGEGRAAREAAD